MLPSPEPLALAALEASFSAAAVSSMFDLAGEQHTSVSRCFLAQKRTGIPSV